jgi:hypothetical protein
MVVFSRNSEIPSPCLRASVLSNLPSSFSHGMNPPCPKITRSNDPFSCDAIALQRTKKRLDLEM